MWMVGWSSRFVRALRSRRSRFPHRAATSEIRATSGSHVAASGGKTSGRGWSLPYRRRGGQGAEHRETWQGCTVAGPWNPDRQVWELRYDRVIALGLETGSSRTPGPSGARASDCRCREGRPKHLPAEAGRYPDVDAGIHRWMPASDGEGGALQSNYSWASQKPNGDDELE
jgi:hypothetical protein